MLQNYTMMNVAKVFFDYPTEEHYLKEISRASKIAHTSVKNNLMDMKKEEIITEVIEKKGKRKFPIYKANLENPSYRKLKKIHNLINLQDSGMIGFLKDKLMPRCIVLFGSYQRGEDIEESDIDIYIQGSKEEINLDRFKKKLNRNIKLHFNENFDEYSKELKNNIINGIVIYGYLEVFE